MANRFSAAKEAKEKKPEEKGFLSNPKLMGDEEPAERRAAGSRDGHETFPKTVRLTLGEIALVQAHVGLGKEYSTFSAALSAAIKSFFGE